MEKKVTSKINRAVLVGISSLMISTCFAQGLTSNKSRAASVMPFTSPSYHVTHYVGIDAPDGQLKDSLAGLKQKAKAGDASAAAAVYAGLLQCKNLTSSTTAVGPKFSDHCTGITAEDMAEAGQWLSMAAEGGDKNAQYVYAGGLYVLYGDKKREDIQPALVNHYEETSAKYLLGLADQCNYEAISDIAADSGRDEPHFGGNVNLSYKFAVVENLLSGSPDALAWSSKQVAQLESKLANPGDAFRLRKEASEFAKSHCH